MNSHSSDWVNWGRVSGGKNAASDSLDFFIPTHSGDVSDKKCELHSPPQKVGTGGKKAFKILGAYPSLDRKPLREGGEDDRAVWMRVTNRLLGKYSLAKPKAGPHPPTEEIHEEFKESPLTTFITEMMKDHDVSIERAKDVAQARERARVNRNRGCVSTSPSSTSQDSQRKRQRVSIK